MVKDKNSWRFGTKRYFVFLPIAYLTKRLPSNVPAISEVKITTVASLLWALLLEGPKLQQD
jgi:hypothetical protein